MKLIITSLHLILLLAAASQALAAPAAGRGGRSDRSNLPITIKASQLTADNKGRKAVFTGKVVARQGDITIFSDRLTIHYGSTKNEVEKVEADGNVRIVQQNRVGSAEHAVYDSAAGKITLSGGNPRVTQGGDSTSGKIITYMIDDERSIVTGDPGAPVVTVIHPKGKKNNDAPR